MSDDMCYFVWIIFIALFIIIGPGYIVLGIIFFKTCDENQLEGFCSDESKGIALVIGSIITFVICAMCCLIQKRNDNIPTATVVLELVGIVDATPIVNF